MRRQQDFPTRTIFALAAIFIVSNLFAAGETNPAAGQLTRPPHWAVKLDKPGLPNLFRVTTNLYRGAQPTAEGMAQLKSIGVKTIVNLRAYHSDKDELAGTGLKSERFHTTPWHGETEDVIRFLKIVADTNNLPAFVHCQRGADRTGMMCAMYRIAICGWTKPQATEEMKKGEFGFNPAWRNLVALVEKADIGELRIKAGIAPQTDAAESKR